MMILIMIVIKIHAIILASHQLYVLICLNQPKQKIRMQNFVSLELIPSRVRHQKLRSRHWKVYHTSLMWPVTD